MGASLRTAMRPKLFTATTPLLAKKHGTVVRFSVALKLIIVFYGSL
jgi:hypothetical protein